MGIKPLDGVINPFVVRLPGRSLLSALSADFAERLAFEVRLGIREGLSGLWLTDPRGVIQSDLRRDEP